MDEMTHEQVVEHNREVTRKHAEHIATLGVRGVFPYGLDLPDRGLMPLAVGTPPHAD